MRALAAATEGRTDVFPRGIRLAPEALLYRPVQTFSAVSEVRGRHNAGREAVIKSTARQRLMLTMRVFSFRGEESHGFPDNALHHLWTSRRR
jgi:hypothetical protein